jgi:hypothetical protein
MRFEQQSWERDSHAKPYTTANFYFFVKFKYENEGKERK